MSILDCRSTSDGNDSVLNEGESNEEMKEQADGGNPMICTSCFEGGCGSPRPGQQCGDGPDGLREDSPRERHDRNRRAGWLTHAGCLAAGEKRR